MMHVTEVKVKITEALFLALSPISSVCLGLKEIYSNGLNTKSYLAAITTVGILVVRKVDHGVLWIIQRILYSFAM